MRLSISLLQLQDHPPHLGYSMLSNWGSLVREVTFAVSESDTDIINEAVRAASKEIAADAAAKAVKAASQAVAASFGAAAIAILCTATAPTATRCTATAPYASKRARTVAPTTAVQTATTKCVCVKFNDSATNTRAGSHTRNLLPGINLTLMNTMVEIYTTRNLAWIRRCYKCSECEKEYIACNKCGAMFLKWQSGNSEKASSSITTHARNCKVVPGL